MQAKSKKIIFLIILTIVTAGIVLFLITLIKQNNDKAYEQIPEYIQKQQDEINKQTPQPDAANDWSKIECPANIKEKIIQYSPNSSPADDCSDKSDTVYVVYGVGHNRSECYANSENNPEYDCKTITINNKEIIKESADFGGGFFTRYYFVNNKDLYVYYHPGDFSTASDAENLIAQF